MKTGLILEGGSMRGLFSAGVMDVFLEHDIEFDGAIGVSAGATFGCNYKSKQPGRVIRYNKRYARDPRYCSFASLLTTGNLYNANFCYHVMPVKYDVFDLETFRKNPMEFWVVTTDLETAEPVYHELKTGDSEDMEWLRASASLPIAARPVKLDGREYMDGGCSDSLPLGFFESQGYDRNVVILTQPKGYVKPVQKALGITKVLLHGQDNLYARLENRHNEYTPTSLWTSVSSSTTRTRCSTSTRWAATSERSTSPACRSTWPAENGQAAFFSLPFQTRKEAQKQNFKTEKTPGRL